MSATVRFLFWSLAIVAAAAGAYYLFAPPSAGTPAPAETGPPDRVIALARLEPAGGVVRLTGTPGDRVDEVLVKEGDSVSSKAELVRFASHRAAEAERNLLVAQREQAATRRGQIEAYGKAQLAVADARIAQLDKLGPLEREGARARIDALTKQAAIAQQELRRFQGVSTVSGQQLAQQRAAVEEAEAALTAAKIARDKAEVEATQARRVAELERESAARNVDRLLAEIPAPLEESLRVVEVRMENGVLRAPSGGHVLKVGARKGEPVTQAPLVQFADTSKMVALAEVYETDVPTLLAWRSRGDVKATLSSRVLGEQRLTGRVVQVGSLIGRNQTLDIDPVADADRRVVEVRIELNEPEVAARFINLQVTAELAP